jgi:PIN domain nuclease of toxin-antitoxin system
MLRAIADTHTVIWYVFADKRLSEAAQMFIEETAATGDQIGCSSITLAEMVYLIEKGRIKPDALGRLLATFESREAVLVDIPFDRYIAQAMRRVDRTQVPDLPDRIIAATALHLGLPLISRDHKIQLADVETIW